MSSGPRGSKGDRKAADHDDLAEYRRKRDFALTSEPSGDDASKAAPTSARSPRAVKSPSPKKTTRKSARRLQFVIQKHAASHLHFDLRLEMGGAMKSWAVPKGPSLDPSVRRLAVQVEDHPIAYNSFEGTIPPGEYGGGTVMIWDRGSYSDASEDGGSDDSSLLAGYDAGKLDITLEGERVRGEWTLVRTHREGKPQWLLMKRSDEYATAEVDIVASEETSVVTGRTMDEIAAGKRGRAKTKKATVADKRGPAKKKATSSGGRVKARRSSSVSSSERGSSASSRSGPAIESVPPLEPMYASVGHGVPGGDNWTFEPKYDGIRVLAYVTGSAVRLMTRNDNDKSAQFPEVVSALRSLSDAVGHPFVLDGEVVATTDGLPARFQQLQGRMHTNDQKMIARMEDQAPAALMAFDLLLDGDDILLAEPWTARRARLERLVAKNRAPQLMLAESDIGDEAAMMKRARDGRWEGIMAKRTDAKYEPGVRVRHWQKLKIEHRQEFVVGGFTEPRGNRRHLGALLIGYFDDDGRLMSAGHVGGGFTDDALSDIARRLAPLQRASSPFATPIDTNEPAHWVKPEVVVEVKFNQWTDDGRLRQPVFVGVRDDKDAREVGREAESVQDEKSAAKKTASKKSPVSKSAAEKSPSKRAAKKSAAESTGTAASSRTKSQNNAATAKTARVVRKAAGKSAEARARVAVGSAPSPVVRELARVEESGGSGSVKLGRGVSLDVTNLDKVYFPAAGYTKGDVMRYYATVRSYVLPVVADRPLVLRRFPNGIDGKAFYQHRAEQVPEGVRTEPVALSDGAEAVPFLIGGDLATLLYTVQLGAISVDPWHGRVDDVHAADYTILDLDPGPRASFGRVVEVARAVKSVLDDLGLRAALKTSGATGLHIHVPLARGTSAEAALILGQLIATRVVSAHPKIATVERSVAARAADAVYVDYLQNIPGKTVAGAYAVRARAGATVSTPLSWEELNDDLDPTSFTIITVPERLEKVGDLWRSAMGKRNSKRVLQSLARAPAGGSD